MPNGCSRSKWGVPTHEQVTEPGPRGGVGEGFYIIYLLYININDQAVGLHALRLKASADLAGLADFLDPSF